MLFVKTEDLKPGMRLAKPIYNRNGVMLYERNSKITSNAAKVVNMSRRAGLCFMNAILKSQVKVS